MKSIITVIGTDRVGIIGEICSLLASMQVNIIDISQTVMHGLFTMTMLVDSGDSAMTFDQISDALQQHEAKTGLSIRIQREDIFNAMHRI